MPILFSILSRGLPNFLGWHYSGWA
jgi:hypothetical protein